MSDHPKISIISTVYNTGPYLRPAVESILAQTFTDFELLLVDDGSHDGSAEVCDALAAQDTRIRVFHQANGGPAHARNTGLDAASGEWVLFLDADDALLPGLWSALDGVITDADMILFGLTRVSTGDIQPTDYLPAGEYADLAALGGALSPLLFDTGLLAAPYPKLFRRRTLGGLRFDDQLQINEDVLFNIQFLQISSAIYCLHGVYYKQYDTESGSLSRRLRGDLLDAERITRPALAALLHDAAKEISKDEMCAIMQAHPEYAEGGEARPTPVWHGVCASILARTEWGVTDEAVLSAIACHTAGKPGMTQLDKILYLADMTSAERDWPGVEKLRKLELKDLNAAMLAALKQTNDFVLSQGKPLDPMSKAAYEDILAHSAQNGENA